MGHNEEYWQELKLQLNSQFERPNPADNETPITKHILDAGEKEEFAMPNPDNRLANIPSYQEYSTYGEGNPTAKQLYQFPTQFNNFGQRVHSGVSIVDWLDSRLHPKTNCSVKSLNFEPSNGDGDATARGKSLTVEDKETGNSYDIGLNENAKVILCAGAASPRLLMPHRDQLNNHGIGEKVSDQIVLPLGIYLPSKCLSVSAKDVYAPVFASDFSKLQEYS